MPKYKRIYLKNVKKYALVDQEVYEKMKDLPWHVDTSNGYATYSDHTKMESGKYSCKKHYMHHMVIGIKVEGKEIDHINQNKLDNRRVNLRFVSRAENIINRRKARKDSHCGIRNVHKKKNGTWEAKVKREGVGIFIGTFSTKRRAISARNSWLNAHTEKE